MSFLQWKTHRGEGPGCLECYVLPLSSYSSCVREQEEGKEGVSRKINLAKATMLEEEVDSARGTDKCMQMALSSSHTHEHLASFLNFGTKY